MASLHTISQVVLEQWRSPEDGVEEEDAEEGRGFYESKLDQEDFVERLSEEAASEKGLRLLDSKLSCEEDSVKNFCREF